MRIGGEFVAPLRFGGVVYLGDDGARTFYDRATATMKLTASVQTKVIRADGTLEAPSPGADPLREWLREAQGDEDLRDALSLLGEGDDWPDLYKVYEFARNGLGGQAEVDALIGPKPRRRLTQTMNHYRHARVKGPPLPPDPPSFNDAVAEVGQLVEAWLPRR